jgi:hypothetical protein
MGYGAPCWFSAGEIPNAQTSSNLRKKCNFLKGMAFRPFLKGMAFRPFLKGTAFRPFLKGMAFRRF